MSRVNHMPRWDESHSRVTCRCGAVYEIYEDDGIPGCREIEEVTCQFCHMELASHFGTCNGTLVDATKVPEALKSLRETFKRTVEGLPWSPEYEAHYNKWKTDVSSVLEGYTANSSESDKV